jgi:hypothetical protein
MRGFERPRRGQRGGNTEDHPHHCIHHALLPTNPGFKVTSTFPYVLSVVASAKKFPEAALHIPAHW